MTAPLIVSSMPHRAWGSRQGSGGYGGAMRAPVVPLLEPALGVVWWTIGALALPDGPGTVVLAAGLGVTGVLAAAGRRRNGWPVGVPPGVRTRLVRIAVVAVVVVVLTAVLLSLADLGELTVPVACAVAGAAMFPAASTTDERAWVLAGGALLVLGAVGSLFALDSAGDLYSHGVVGMVAAVVVWLVGAHRIGLLDEMRLRR